MAVDTEIFTPDGKFFGLTGVDQPRSTLSAIPRQELFFDLVNQAVAVPEAGDSQLVEIICFLPIAFAYVLTEVFCGITGADSNDWSSRISLNLHDGQDSSTDTYRLLWQSEASSDQLVGSVVVRSWNCPKYNIPNRVVIPRATGAEFKVHANNATVDGTAQSLQFGCRFLVFDIAQAHHFLLNTPQLIR